MNGIRKFITSLLLTAALAGAAIGCSSQKTYYSPSSATTASQASSTTKESTTAAKTEKASTEEATETEEASTEEASTDEPASESAASGELTVGSTWYVNTTQLNIREEPSVYANIIGELYRTEEVLILELTDDGWAKITSATGVGYVKTEFLSPTRDGSTASNSTNSTEGSQTVSESTVSSEGNSESSAEPETAAPASSSSADAAAAVTTGNGHIVCIDAGHQQAGISEQEANGPGSSVMKAKLTTGTSGVATGQTEYQFNLDVSLMLKAELVKRGYTVVMIRESNDCPLSNAERAQVANNSGAEIFVRIHANSIDDSSVTGALFYAPSPANPYLSSELVTQSNNLSQVMVDSYCATTGLVNRGVLQDDSMTGINWCQIPVTIAELGFMSNPDEDTKMADPTFQALMAEGLANGIDAYFGL